MFLAKVMISLDLFFFFNIGLWFFETESLYVAQCDLLELIIFLAWSPEHLDYRHTPYPSAKM